MIKTRVSLGFTHPFGANGSDYSIPRSVISKLDCDASMN